ncbi:unnamed protein product [Rotaria magnacalcarata]|uniref:Aminotransferase class V domain-containing protein n=1 Tax=Rotaria magnacalcarata TaxID=392030 RepID=A0A8S2NNK9_9BILA|nr:unnamed protein product [Rotaria magnacalcarata]
MDIKENDSKLFTPGPLTTSLTVKEAMLHDLGSRDTIFLNIIAHIRGKLLELADVSADEHAAVLVQGSGTYAVEATFSTTIPHQGAKVLIIENGAYGQRMTKICRILNIPHDVISFHETERVQVDLVANKLQSNHYTHVAIIHCETSSGILNPIEEIGQLVYDHGTTKGSTVYIVDSMSAFGAIPNLSDQLNSILNASLPFRYEANNKLIREKMKTLGFIELIKPEYQTYIITSYYYPSAPFNFQTFYNKLSEKHQLIYPGKTTETDCFRIGNIGRLFENDMATLAECIKEVCEEMNIELPLTNNTKQ